MEWIIIAHSIIWMLRARILLTLQQSSCYLLSGLFAKELIICFCSFSSVVLSILWCSFCTYLSWSGYLCILSTKQKTQHHGVYWSISDTSLQREQQQHKYTTNVFDEGKGKFVSIQSSPWWMDFGFGTNETVLMNADVRADSMKVHSRCKND